MEKDSSKKSKLIFVSDSLADIQQVQKIADRCGYPVEHYSTREWNKRGRGRPARSFTFPPSVIPISQAHSHASPHMSLRQLQGKAIKQALTLSRGNVSKACGLLKVGRATFYRKVQSLRLKPNSFREAPLKIKPRRVKKAA